MLGDEFVLINTQKDNDKSMTTTIRPLKYRNQNLYDALRAFTLKAMQVISSSKEIPIKIPIISESGWNKQSDRAYLRVHKQLPLWAIIVDKCEKKLFALPEYEKCVEVIKCDELLYSQTNTLIGTCMGSWRIETNNVITAITRKLLAEKNSFIFEPEIFESEYLRIENAFYENEIEFERLTPLYGFTSTTFPIQLNNNISIVKLTELEITTLLKVGIKLGIEIGMDFIHDIAQFAIRIQYKLPKVIGDKRIEKDERLRQAPFITANWEQKIVDSLRVYKHGTVYALGTATISSNFFNMMTTFTYGMPPINFIKNNYKLDQDEVQGFKEFWHSKNNLSISEKHFLTIAIGRFSQANDRIQVEDKIIDLFICSEALFLSSGGSFHGELKYRLSHRAAMFIEGDVDSKKRAFKFMRDAYNVRSDIVHGKSPKLPKKADGSKYSLEEFAKDAEEYLRRALKKAIMLPQDPDSPKFSIDWESVIFPTEH